MEIEVSDSARLDGPEVISGGTQARPQNVCAMGDSARDLRLQTRRVVLRPQTDIRRSADRYPRSVNRVARVYFLGAAGAATGAAAPGAAAAGANAVSTRLMIASVMSIPGSA